jgi:hypothetical protein
MKTWNSVRMIGAVAVAALLAASQANGIVAFDNTAVVQNQSSGGPYALGMDFVVNSPILVDAIGAFHSGSGDFLDTIPVAIFNVANHSQPVAGTTVTFSGSPSSYSYSTANSVFQSITPVTLLPGTYSIVAAGYGGSGEEPYYWTMANQTPTPVFHDGGGLVTMVPQGGRWAGNQSSVTPFPTGSTAGFNAPNYAAGTFDFTPVPEVATFGAASVGLLGLVYIGRYARLRRKMKLG